MKKSVPEIIKLVGPCVVSCSHLSNFSINEKQSLAQQASSLWKCCFGICVPVKKKLYNKLNSQKNFSCIKSQDPEECFSYSMRITNMIERQILPLLTRCNVCDCACFQCLVCLSIFSVMIVQCTVPRLQQFTVYSYATDYK